MLSNVGQNRVRHYTNKTQHIYDTILPSTSLSEAKDTVDYLNITIELDEYFYIVHTVHCH